MSDQLLIVLRVCLLALMYLVFLRVLRAVWVEMKGGVRSRATTASVPVVATAGPTPGASTGTRLAPHPAATGSPPSTRTLVVVEPAAHSGTAFPLDAETTIGRAVGCRISVDDTHVSKVHARVFVHSDTWYVEDLGSTNGTLVNEMPASRATALEIGDRVRVGETVLEVR